MKTYIALCDSLSVKSILRIGFRRIHQFKERTTRSSILLPIASSNWRWFAFMARAKMSNWMNRKERNNRNGNCFVAWKMASDAMFNVHPPQYFRFHYSDIAAVFCGKRDSPLKRNNTKETVVTGSVRRKWSGVKLDRIERNSSERRFIVGDSHKVLGGGTRTKRISIETHARRTVGLGSKEMWHRRTAKYEHWPHMKLKS